MSQQSKPKQQQAHLRKRQIVIVGQGTSILAFCDAFRSDWAEITVISTVSDYAPLVVRNGIAAGHLKPEDFTRLFRVRFSKRKNLRFIDDRVTGVDLEHRLLHLENQSTSLQYDFMLLGDQGTNHPDAIDEQKTILSLNTVATATRLQQRIQTAASRPNIQVHGADSKAIDLASTLTRSALIPLGKKMPAKVTLQIENGFVFPNRQVESKVEKTFAEALRWESISLLEASVAEKVHGEAIHVSAFLPIMPNWFPETIMTDADPFSLVRPDLQLRKVERVYLLPELIQIKDSVGTLVPADDAAWRQQGRYLAKLLRGIIEVRARYQTDAPGFVLRNTLSLVTVRKWKSLGFWGKRPLRPLFAFLLDACCVQFPVFQLTYGTSDGFMKMLRWLNHCK